MARKNSRFKSRWAIVGGLNMTLPLISHLCTVVRIACVQRYIAGLEICIEFEKFRQIHTDNSIVTLPSVISIRIHFEYNPTDIVHFLYVSDKPRVLSTPEATNQCKYLLKTLRRSYASCTLKKVPHKIFLCMQPRLVKKNHPRLSILRSCPDSLLDISLLSLVLYFHNHSFK